MVKLPWKLFTLPFPDYTTRLQELSFIYMMLSEGLLHSYSYLSLCLKPPDKITYQRGTQVFLYIDLLGVFCVLLVVALISHRKKSKFFPLSWAADECNLNVHICWLWGLEDAIRLRSFSYLHVKPESCHHRRRRGRRCLILECVLADSGTLYGPKKKKRQKLPHVPMWLQKSYKFLNIDASHTQISVNDSVSNQISFLEFMIIVLNESVFENIMMTQ